MIDVPLLLSVLVSSAAGTFLGFLAGLVPGLHMNNIAAVITAYGSAALAVFGAFALADTSNGAGIAISCFISSAVVSHIFSESVVSTYVGVPAEDVVSVLPAHRLAKAGLGTIAVNSSADGALAGVLIGAALLFPVCAVMGFPLFAYDSMSKAMPIVISAFIVMLLISEGYPFIRTGHHVQDHARRMASAFVMFMASGVLGTAVLLTDYYAAPMPDFPWIQHDFVPKSSLLLPMFAGFFGVPSLLLSMGSRKLSGMALPCGESRARGISVRETLTMLFGGIMVGWLPGMTSGSAATACSPSMTEDRTVEDVSSASRFVWLYSAISASGAVMSVGALFVIQRARSGSMDAVSFFMGASSPVESWLQSVQVMSAILLSMVLSSLISRWAIRRFLPILSRSSGILCSRALAVSSLLFVTGLSLSITGVRGALVMACAASLGVLAPLAGIRRLQLMGSLLVPIWILFVTSM